MDEEMEEQQTFGVDDSFSVPCDEGAEDLDEGGNRSGEEKGKKHKRGNTTTFAQGIAL
jgi:hypothetical protein